MSWNNWSVSAAQYCLPRTTGYSGGRPLLPSPSSPPSPPPPPKPRQPSRGFVRRDSCSAPRPQCDSYYSWCDIVPLWLCATAHGPAANIPALSVPGAAVARLFSLSCGAALGRTLCCPIATLLAAYPPSHLRKLAEKPTHHRLAAICPVFCCAGLSLAADSVATAW